VFDRPAVFSQTQAHDSSLQRATSDLLQDLIGGIPVSHGPATMAQVGEHSGVVSASGQCPFETIQGRGERTLCLMDTTQGPSGMIEIRSKFQCRLQLAKRRWITAQTEQTSTDRSTK
jgi:hypothetical protein